jgi:Protein of unknown function (DUF4065)
MAQFDEKKATQAAAIFLKLAGDRLNYMVLIKYLYLADREALSLWARPVINDDYFSMKLGPVLSHVRDLITEQPVPNEDNFWSRHISAPSNYEVNLTADPGNDQLSEGEEELIGRIYEQYKDYRDRPFDFAEYLHSILPEWDRIKEGRSPIALRSILLAAHKSAEEINRIVDDIDQVNFVQSFFGVRG